MTQKTLFFFLLFFHYLAVCVRVYEYAVFGISYFSIVLFDDDEVGKQL